MDKMRKLETYIIEKLKVTKGSGVPNLLSILDSTNREEFELQCENLIVYLKDNSYLPLAELDGYQNDLKSLDEKYQNGNDTFLWVRNNLIYYGTWDESYSTYWSKNNNIVKTITNGKDGFKDFVCTDREIMKNKGVFIITENEDLMKQIDILKKKAELIA